MRWLRCSVRLVKWIMNRLFDTLEICLQEIEKGRDVETILSQYPDLADELRPILVTAIKARSMSAPLPSTDAERRGRARVMQRAAQLRESKVAPRQRVIPVFQRLAMSFALLLVFMLSGSGILSASASALPGESLYPVKRGWEGVRLFFIFDREARELLANEFENERLHEVNELLSEGRHETIQVAGVFMQVNGKTYISGLQVVLPANVQMPENGAAVVVTGRTNAQGFIEVTSLELLPAGSVVPAGAPIEVESELEPEAKPTSSAESAGVAQPTQPAYYEFQGTLQSMSNVTLLVSDMTVYLDNSQIKDQLCVGMTVEVKGYYAEDGRFMVTEVEGKGSCAGESGSSGSQQDSNSNNAPESNDDNGGGGGSENNDNGDDHSGSDDNSDDDDSGDDNNGNDSGGGDDNDND